MDEFERIAWMRQLLAADPRVEVGIGDDTAVTKTDGDRLLITVDMLLEGVHFDLAHCQPRDVGHKAMDVNLSDIAAMAGRPTVAVVAVGIPTGSSDDLAAELFFGLREAAERFGVAIVGGDTNRSPGGLVVSVTLLGVPTGPGPVLRSGARPGDALCVTGSLGYSLDGKHLRFVPRVLEAQRLHANYSLSAMMDLSDGLGSDLFRLTDESGCGAIVDAESIPIREATSSDDRAPLDHAINDGEDFELLFTLPRDQCERMLREEPLDEFGVTITRIGEITADRSVLLRQGGATQPLARGGFVHRW